MFEKSVYENRRRKLKSKISGGIALIPGNEESPMNYADNPYHFRQDSTFLYFFGLDFPGLAGIIDFDSGEDYIFGDDADIDDIIWMGPQQKIAEKALRSGVNKTAPVSKMQEFIDDVIKLGRRVHFLPPYRGENIIKLEKLTGISVREIHDYCSMELIRAVIDLRSVKESCEIDEIKIACGLGYNMHLSAMQLAMPGIWEQYITGTLEGIAAGGGGRISFPIILTQNGETLHNHDHSGFLEEGRLLLTDAGAESPMHYSSDFTRTVPVGGKFSSKQRDIYNIVLAANNKTRELISPDVTFMSVHMGASEVIASGLKELGLMKGDVSEAVRNGAHALFFPHGIGHMMGLDVHDMEDLGQIYVGFDDEVKPSSQFGTSSLRLGRRLHPGFVVTNEPGIYFIPALIDKWQSEKINAEFINFDKVNEYRDFGGIRLEDDILVTASGSEILGERLPIKPEEIEKIITGI
ncbi:MAG: M24 family metallopeptidase [Bacteroidales bacterium]|jgi:Xaa-Pro aminopeptidase|nr:M24 family metallopeptidase [Bacteroidales bacterium]